MSVFRNNLLSILRDNAMTVSELSERSGVPYSSIASWLGERASLPNIDTVCLIADTLDCSIDYLVGREDMNGTIISSGEHLSKDESAFLELYRQLSNRQKFAALNFVKGMLAG